MKSYQIIIKYQGVIKRVVEFITAANALEAINFVEANYDSRTFELSNKNGSQIVKWTGFEFEARRMEMVLS